MALWEVADPRHPRKVGQASGEEDRFISFEFHPQGNLLVGADQDGDFVMWAVQERSLSHRVATLSPHRQNADRARFTPNGRYLLTSDGGSVYVWDLDDFPELGADTLGRACEVAGGGLTEKDWRTYAPGLTYEKTCP
ncbi:WD40 repeat domain-containing protein [Streptomyces vilmorinianum]|uniref:WD40 repeat domain-containing protein n=1 Tax=Streptomyces vilmorinianum TaxID=3051092 RepID=UPI0010FBB90A|nr:hypothetical protein [Streptomyces vilmorinianum]